MAETFPSSRSHAPARSLSPGVPGGAAGNGADGGRIARWIDVASAVVLVACLLILARLLPFEQAVLALQSGVGRLGAFGPLVFAGAYILAGLLFLPGSALTIAAGAVFGLLWGTAIVSVASTTTAALAFLVARYLARARVERAAQRYRRFAAIDQAIGRGGWKIVALLRLSPAVPYSLGNYLYGLTPIQFLPYVLASWAFMLPGTFLYVYIGHLGAAGVKAAGGGADALGWGRAALLAAGLAATVVVTVYVTRLARRALAEHGALSSQAPDGATAEYVAAPTTSRVRAGGNVLRIAALAVMAVTATVWIGRHALRNMFGPPTVHLREAYSDSVNGVSFDHSRLDALLRRHVSEGGWVDYPGLKSDAADLDAYIESLAAAPFDRLGRDDKLALLINAYNAFTLRLILDHDPIESIRDIPAARRWDDPRWNVAGHTWSLNQIEHEEIRPKFREPRIHFALVCAAVGCPPLRREAYTGAALEAQLSDQARYVHAHGRWFRFDRGGTVGLTRLYDWYGDDFRQVAGSVIRYVAEHSADLKSALASGAPVRIVWLDYDWRLNSREYRP